MTFQLSAALVAVLACLVVGRSAGSLVRIMRPGQAVVLLTATSLAVSLAAGFTLTAIAAAVIASLTSVAERAHWSAAIIRSQVPMPGWLGALAAVAVCVLLLRAAVRTWTILLALVRADRLCRHIRAGGGPVVMVDDDSADAYTVAGLRGCVVISRRLFTRLTEDERRVLTSHELSHLSRRHHLYIHITDIAAAANPLLGPVSAAVRLGVERWADEDAAADLGDRRLTGRALARVALLRSTMTSMRTAGHQLASPRGVLPTLGVGGQDVAARVQALLQPAPRLRVGPLASCLILAAGVLLIGLESLDHTQDAIESAAPYLQRLIHG